MEADLKSLYLALRLSLISADFFDSISEFFITKPSLCGRLVSMYATLNAQSLNSLKLTRMFFFLPHCSFTDRLDSDSVLPLGTLRRKTSGLWVSPSA